MRNGCMAGSPDLARLPGSHLLLPALAVLKREACAWNLTKQFVG